MTIELSQNQIAIILELLRPYNETSVMLTNQLKTQMAGAAEIPHAKKIDEQETK